ncbi:MAG: hypothetical protein R3Y49_04425 [Rikenellaceae bacterium]
MLDFILGLTLYEQIIFGVLIVTLFYSIFVWLGFSIVATHRHHARLKPDEPQPSVSVIVIVSESTKWFVEDGLEKLLEQEYAGDWEVVVVNDWGGTEVTNNLEILSKRYCNLRFTELKKDPKFPHSRKIPLMLGIKAANYENLLFSDPSVAPKSNKWLKLMSRGFIGGRIVVGYSGFTQGTSGYIRSSRMMTSIRFLSAAVGGNGYRGIYNNFGYTKRLFFSTRGFTHLRLSTGEDDLFVQHASKGGDISVILNPYCSCEQYPQGGLKWWWNEQRYQTYSFKYYPKKVKFRIFMELFMKLLFFCSVTLSVLMATLWGGWQWGWAVGVGAFLIREWVMLRSLRRICKRVGERKLTLSFMLYDLVNPVTECLLAISRRLKVNKELWK